MSGDGSDRVRAFAERPLSAEAFEAALAAPQSAEEIAERRSLVRWFCTRYPTPAARLAYARRAARRLWRPVRRASDQSIPSSASATAKTSPSS